MYLKEEIREHLHSLNLPPEGLKWALEQLDLPPSRSVTGRQSPTVQYASRMLGHSIDLESNGVELPGHLGYEFLEKDVRWVCWQPRPVTLQYIAKLGRPTTVLQTVDAFVIRDKSVGLEEWKAHEKLLQLAIDMPNRYVQKANGAWTCPPGEKAVASMGFYYTLRSSAEINWYLQTAIDVLEDYWRPDSPPVNQDIQEYLVDLVKRHQGVNLAKLRKLSAKGTPEDILKLIASGVLYVDLAQYPLDQEYRVPVFADKATADAFSIALKAKNASRADINQLYIMPGSTFLWDNKEWEVLNDGEKKVYVRPTQEVPEDTMSIEPPRPITLTYEEIWAYMQNGIISGLPSKDDEAAIAGEILDVLKRAGPDGMKRAVQRHNAILPILNGDVTDSDSISRTQYDWLAKYRQAERTLGNGFYGLIDNYGNCGNYRETFAEDVILFAEQYISEHYEDATQPNKQAVLRDYRLECDKRGIAKIGEKKFLKLIKLRSGPAQTNKRAGHKAAQQQEPWYLYMDYRTPRHGVRPFHIVHVDHTQLDDELVDSETGKNMGRPWLTVVMDAFTRRILVIYLTYDEPSYRTLMIVIRLLVKRYGRVPKYIVCDQGKEFKSIYFKALMALLGVSIKYRNKPREGSVIESYFKATNKEFVHNLKANTQIMKFVREVTQLVDPSNHAIWFLEPMYVALEIWAYEIYDCLEHPALGESPRDAFNRTLHTRGERKHTLIPYDQNFLWLTLPSSNTDAGQKVNPERGIKINYIWYSCDELRDPALAGERVPAKYDPFNLGVAYAYINKRWVMCLSEHFGSLQGHTERELKLVTEELRQRKRGHHQRIEVNGYQIALFFQDVSEQETLMQRARDIESYPMRAVIESLGIWMPYSRALTITQTGTNFIATVPPLPALPEQLSDVPVDCDDEDDVDDDGPDYSVEYMDWKS